MFEKTLWSINGFVASGEKRRLDSAFFQLPA
jgi:hypothetical protein